MEAEGADSPNHPTDKNPWAILMMDPWVAIRLPRNISMPTQTGWLICIPLTLTTTMVFLPTKTFSDLVYFVPSFIVVQLNCRGIYPILLQKDWVLGFAEPMDTESLFPLSVISSDDLLLPLMITRSSWTGQFKNMFLRHPDIFTQHSEDYGRTSLTECEIHTTGPPTRQPYRHYNPTLQSKEEKQIEHMLYQGVIRLESVSIHRSYCKKERWSTGCISTFKPSIMSRL